MCPLKNLNVQQSMTFSRSLTFIYSKLHSSLNKAKDEDVKEFKAFGLFTKFLDENYAIGFEDFCQDAIKAFLGMDFSSIKLLATAKSSLLLASSEDVNAEDDATTPLPPRDENF